MKILLTGGSGLLGQELQKHREFIAPSHTEFDILNPTWNPGADLIVHAAAYTDVEGAETNRAECFETNVIGTYNMAKLGIPMIYISTEYVFDGRHGNYDEKDVPNPQNYYAWTKWIGEDACRVAPESLVVRLVFKPRPWKYESAFIDQWTSGDYVDAMASKLIQVIDNFCKFKQHDTVHIGTGRKSIYDLARQSRPVEPMERRDVEVKLPEDTSLDTTYFDEVIYGQN